MRAALYWSRCSCNDALSFVPPRVPYHLAQETSWAGSEGCSGPSHVVEWHQPDRTKDRYPLHCECEASTQLSKWNGVQEASVSQIPLPELHIGRIVPATPLAMALTTVFCAQVRHRSRTKILRPVEWRQYMLSTCHHPCRVPSPWFWYQGSRSQSYQLIRDGAQYTKGQTLWTLPLQKPWNRSFPVWFGVPSSQHGCRRCSLAGANPSHHLPAVFSN